MVPTTKEALRKLVTDTTIEIYEDLTPQLIQMIVIRHNMDTIDRLKPNWFEMGDEGFQVTVNELPVREQIDVPVREQLIVELYSK